MGPVNFDTNTFTSPGLNWTRETLYGRILLMWFCFLISTKWNSTYFGLKFSTGRIYFSALDCCAWVLEFEFGILPLLKHTCGEQGLFTLLAVMRFAGVAPEVNLTEYTSCTLVPSVNKVEVQYKGISGPIKGHASTQKLFKKEFMLS